VRRRSLLEPAAARAIEQRVAAVEARCGVEITCAIYRRSHTYPEASWLSFATGVVIAAFVVVMADLLDPAWLVATSLVWRVVGILGVGALCALLAMVAPPWTRLLVPRARRDLEARRCAKEVFVHRALSATRERDAVLVFASVFERKVEIIADRGFEGRVPPQAWNGIVTAMLPHLRRGHSDKAFVAALDALEKVLVHHGYTGTDQARDPLPNVVIQSDGAR
jgi:putative membrane protein